MHRVSRGPSQSQSLNLNLNPCCCCMYVRTRKWVDGMMQEGEDKCKRRDTHVPGLSMFRPSWEDE